MDWKAVQAYIRQPTTLGGISAALGIVSSVLMHQMTWVQSVPLLLACGVAIVVKDNTSTILHQAQANAAAIVQQPTPKP